MRHLKKTLCSFLLLGLTSVCSFAQPLNSSSGIFDKAMQDYRAGRYSSAADGFVTVTNRGKNADATFYLGLSQYEFALQDRFNNNYTSTLKIFRAAITNLEVAVNWTEKDPTRQHWRDSLFDKCVSIAMMCANTHDKKNTTYFGWGDAADFFGEAAAAKPISADYNVTNATVLSHAYAGVSSADAAITFERAMTQIVQKYGDITKIPRKSDESLFDSENAGYSLESLCEGTKQNITRYTGAIDRFSKILVLQPNNYNAISARARARYGLWFSQIFLISFESALRKGMTLGAADNNLLTLALNDYNSVIAASGDTVSSTDLFGRAKVKRALNNHQGAIEDLNRIATFKGVGGYSLDFDVLAPYKQLNGFSYQDVYDNLYSCLNATKETAKAEFMLKAYLCFNQKKNQQQKIELGEAFLEKFPEHILLYEEIGNAYLTLEKNAEAEYYFLQAIKKGTYVIHATWFNLGVAYLNQSKLERAMEAFNTSLAFNPNFPNTYRGLAAVYQKMGNKEKAQELLQKEERLKSSNR